MPSDIVGAEVIEEDRATGRRVIRFIQGPLFANIILADEINRTPPKTQAALLEAMQEYQVTVSGQRFTLERPLFVLATQNPIEQEGTYPLPEAQLDRFMFNVLIDYPERGRGAAHHFDDDGHAAAVGHAGGRRRRDRADARARPRSAGGRERGRLRHAPRARHAPWSGWRPAVRGAVCALGRRATRRPGAAARCARRARCSTAAAWPHRTM